LSAHPEDRFAQPLPQPVHKDAAGRPTALCETLLDPKDKKPEQTELKNDWPERGLHLSFWWGTAYQVETGPVYPHCAQAMQFVYLHPKKAA